MTHQLKTWPQYFEAVRDGIKTFEIRKKDRPFAVGDVLTLMEYSPESCTYSGREIDVRVTYEISTGPFAFPGYVVMAIERVDALGKATTHAE